MRRSAFLVLLIVLIALTARVVVRQIERTRFSPIELASLDADVMPVHACVAFRDVRIADAVFLPGDRDLMLYVEVGAVGLWPLAVLIWPELVLLGVLVVALVIATLTRWRRPTTVDPHCRRCDYALVGSAGERCPECGLELTTRNRVRRRSRGWLRVACVCVPIVLAVLYVPGRQSLPRRGAATWWFHWPSTFVYDWLYNRGHAQLVDQFKVYVQRAVRLDPATGRSWDVALDEGKSRMATAQFASSADGTHLAFVLGRDVVLMDTRTRRVERRLRGRAVGDPLDPSNQYAHVAFASDGTRVCGARLNGVVDWWSIDGAPFPAPTPDILAQADEGDFVWIRGIDLAANDALMAVGRSRWGGPPVVQLHHRTPDLGERVAPPVVLPGDVHRLVRAAGGDRWYALAIGTNRGGHLLTAEIDDDDVAALPLGQDHGTALALSPDGRALFVGAFTGTPSGGVSGHAGLRDAETLDEFAQLGTREMAVLRARFSRNGRRLVTSGSVRTTAMSGQSSIVAVYDLPRER